MNNQSRLKLISVLDMNNNVSVTFTTKDGRQRTMNCTRKLSILPFNKQDGINDPRLIGVAIVAVFDLVNNDWRAFRFDSVIEWKVIS